MMATELKGQALLDYYREALRVEYGDEWAEKSVLTYKGAWYYLTIPRRFANGIFFDCGPSPYRAAHVREMADELLRKAKEADG